MIHVRRLGPDEWELNKRIRLAALAEAPYAFSTTHAEALRRTEADWQRMTHERATSPNSAQFTAYVDEVPVGTASCVAEPEKASAEMFAVWVAPEHRRLGVAAALLAGAMDFARGRGAQTMYVGVFEDNVGALRAYRGLGFADTGQTKPEFMRDSRTVLMLARAL